MARIEAVKIALNLLYPPLRRCLVCDRRLPERRVESVAPGLCPSCHLLVTERPGTCPVCGATVPSPRGDAGSFQHLCEPEEGEIVHWVGADRGPLAALVRRYRGGRASYLVHTLGHLLAGALRPVTESGRDWALVPVPADQGHGGDALDRGRLLARRTAGYLGITHLDLLRCASGGRSGAETRFAPVSWHKLDRAGVKGLIVIDDTYNRGLRLRAARAALREEFAGPIRTAAVIARGTAPSDWPLGIRHNVLSWSKRVE